MQTSATLERFTIPRTFWIDHAERCFEHDGVRELIKENGTHVVVDLDAVALANLESDAEYYVSKYGPDQIGGGLRASARATLRAIAAATIKVMP